MRRFLQNAMVAGLALTLSACADRPTSPNPLSTPSFAVTTNERLPFTFFIPPCNLEAIDGSGIFHIKTSATVSTSGQVTLTFHLNAKGKGTGQTTGAKYEWNDLIQDVLHFDGNDGFPATETARQRFHLIGQGQVPNRVVNVDFQFTVNANGTETQFSAKFVDVCH